MGCSENTQITDHVVLTSSLVVDPSELTCESKHLELNAFDNASFNYSDMILHRYCHLRDMFDQIIK